MKYQKPKGVFDIFPEPLNEKEGWNCSSHWQYVEEIMRKVSKDYGFKEIRTPIFEDVELFERGVGESSDIVSKEMYTFKDKGDRSLTLRPEGTASAMRAFLERGITQKYPYHKFYYIGPMFRYERPQEGRYRQFHQFGAEVIGNKGPMQDVETIDMMCTLFHRLGLKDLTVYINSIGSSKARADYRRTLRAYFEPHLDVLSKESKVRFEKNVMRILDSREEEDLELVANAPTILDSLDQESKEHFEEVKRLLEKLGIPFIVNTKLVRGLDYYNQTVFEVKSGAIGSQSSVGGGGRYDGLIPLLGGPDLPAVGFSCGIERLIQTMHNQGASFGKEEGLDFFFIPMGAVAAEWCFSEITALRRAGIAAVMPFEETKVKRAFDLALSSKARFVLVIGDEEIKNKKCKIKNLESRLEEEISFDGFIETMKRLAKQ